MQGQWIAARDLSITWVDNPQYWTWKTVDPNIEVAELRRVAWLDIYGKIETKNLIRKTSYAVYLVFKLTDNPRELERATASLRFVNEVAEGAGIEGTTVFISKKKELPGELGRFPHLRSDGWLEIKLGEFFNNLGEDGEVEMRLMEINDKTWKSGIIVKGFDIRPN
ncbi:F-box protein PP2-B11-like [Nicotiana tomentosiformis]|uniref:F-box protein PP2-B11 n=1 Tax=Nicotiana tabacum TaxID=4097 RepID=Q3Y625_TOBAC|nr:PREDICTED: F-box protein PP2-B11-like [Nicotiana tabacum]AAZ81598.1 Sam3 [Nicotiana tabacum]AAZ81603.1 Wis [Nicotiana tabacum]